MTVWKDVAAQLAQLGLPLLGRVLGGRVPLLGGVGAALGENIGQVVAVAIAKALGVKPTPEAIGSAIEQGETSEVLARLKAIEAEAAVRWPALAQISEHESKAEVEIARLNAQTAARVAAEVASNGFWLTLYRSIAMYAATLNLIGFGLTFFYGMYLDQALWGRIVEGRDVVAWWIGAMASVLGLHFFSRAQERKAAVTVTREAALRSAERA